jgi:hypothetical protein
MLSPLDGCWAKIERANENIKNLEAEVSAFTHSDRYTIIRNLDRKAKQCTFFAQPQLIPLRVSVLAGEIIHHLRSSLDHVVWALALKKRPDPPFRIQFPIYTESEKFIAAKKSGIIQGISGSAQTIIESVQPYLKPPAADHPLAILHDFSITDKHKLLAVAVSVATIETKIHFSTQMADTPLAEILPKNWSNRRIRIPPEGAIILTILFSAPPPPNMQVYPEHRYDVAFEKFGSREVEPIVPSLIHLRDCVMETIHLFDGEV